jgi:hypothetical protein
MTPNSAAVRWIDDKHFQLADIVFTLTPEQADQPSIKKNKSLIENYLRLRQTRSFHHIVEVGVLWGGSTMFLNEAFKPRLLLAIDAKDQTRPFFQKYLATERGNTIRTRLDLPQNHCAEINSAIDDVFGSADLDLIIDDASHLYPQSVATFETLFPRMGRRGLYIIEDWGWAHWPGFWQTEKAPWQHQLSLANMVFETIMACASRQGMIERVEVTSTMVFIERGAAPRTSMALRSSFFTRGREYKPYL